MKKRKSSKVSLGDVARAAGISKTCVGYALQNRPGVSKITRERVLRIAKRLGYAPDARMTVLMESVRGAKSKELLPIAWLNTTIEKDAWQKYKFHTPLIEGARERALELGYRIEEIWTRERGMTMQRISQILWQRGIEGVIVTHPAKHLRLKWDHQACVSLGGNLLAPRLHQVIGDMNFNLLLALKVLRRHGYRRIGICLPEQVIWFAHREIRSIAYHFVATAAKSDRVPPLFYKGENEADLLDSEKQVQAWVFRHRPDVVVGTSSRLRNWVKATGARVPEDVGIVHLAVDDDLPDWAGIHSNRREMGATAAEWVISLVQNHRFGVPKIGLNMLVRGSWQPGWTLLIPKGK
ncbi:MAG: LacI family DNA-binding transcriptional regulator [Methylacidiphilales bacterium]|nr:LacI family DNA-binding transcriptional regulator [Candidatus Methylacidiphilales bacterium]